MKLFIYFDKFALLNALARYQQSCQCVFSGRTPLSKLIQYAFFAQLFGDMSIRDLLYKNMH